MVKRAKRRRSARDPALDYLPVFDARAQLFNSMLSIGWRLALSVLIPVFTGIWLDNRYDTKPSFTLSAFFIAIFLSGLMIAKMYKELKVDIEKLEAPKKQRMIKNRITKAKRS